VTSAAVIPASTTAPTTDSPSAARSATSSGATAAPEPSALASARAHRRPRLRLLRYEPAAEEPTGPPTPPVPARTRPVAVLTAVTDTADIGALRRRAEQVLRLTLEVLDGRRPVAQLAGHLEPRALRYVRAAVAQRPTGRQPSRMTSLHVDRPCTGALEVAAVYRRGPRARALAARFEPVCPGTAAVRELARGEREARAGDPREWRCVTVRLL
jgi:Family of unknown function (DUF6459)